MTKAVIRQLTEKKADVFTQRPFCRCRAYQCWTKLQTFGLVFETLSPSISCPSLPWSGVGGGGCCCGPYLPPSHLLPSKLTCLVSHSFRVCSLPSIRQTSSKSITKEHIYILDRPLVPQLRGVFDVRLLGKHRGI